MIHIRLFHSRVFLPGCIDGKRRETFYQEGSDAHEWHLSQTRAGSGSPESLLAHKYLEPVSACSGGLWISGAWNACDFGACEYLSGGLSAERGTTSEFLLRDTLGKRWGFLGVSLLPLIPAHPCDNFRSRHNTILQHTRTAVMKAE